MSSQAELIIDVRNGVGESPVRHAVEQALYWTDIPAPKLWRWTAATATAQSWDTPEMLACMAPGPDAGMAFSPDGRTMYLSDSHPSVQLIWAYDYNTQTGIPSNRRVFADMNSLPGGPDGAAVDEDGCYWICGNDAGLIHRFTPQGKLDRSLAVPVKKPAMCAFGGARLDTLFVTSIRPRGNDLSDQPLAGGLFTSHPKVRGLLDTACLH